MTKGQKKVKKIMQENYVQSLKRNWTKLMA